MELAATVIHFDTQLLNFLGGAVVPALVALFTTRLASGRLKVAVLVLLSLVSAAITVALGEPEDGWPLYDYLYSVVQTFIASAVFYDKILKPLGITGAIQDATPKFGVGPTMDIHRDL